LANRARRRYLEVIMKILFPTDGSERSLAALRGLMSHLNWFTETPQIALINVHPQLPYARAVAWVGKEAAAQYYADESGAALAPAGAALAERGVRYEQVAKIGEPAHEIVKFAGEWRADLVAMGRHGQSHIAGMLMGSVAQKVLATVTIPVLLLP
jgi:nucleotide-binding universal stress UspA family protein